MLVTYFVESGDNEMEQSILDLLSETWQALKDGNASGKQARTYLDRCINGLIGFGTSARTDDELRDVLGEYLPALDRLAMQLPGEAADAPFYRSIAAIIRGDYQNYLAETERFYVAKSAEAPDWLNWPAADQYVVSIVSGEVLPVK